MSPAESGVDCGRDGLYRVQASCAMHACLDEGFRGEGPPPADARYRWTTERGCIQSTTGGDGTPHHPRGLHPGPFYSPLTFLTGTRRDGRPATHEDLYPVAVAFFQDPDGMQATWLYESEKWVAAWLPRCPSMDPARCSRSNPAPRLRMLLERATGGEAEDDGGIWYALVYLPERGTATTSSSSIASA